MDDGRIEALVQALRLETLWDILPDEIRAAVALAEAQGDALARIAEPQPS